jgi:hypothetical protein
MQRNPALWLNFTIAPSSPFVFRDAAYSSAETPSGACCRIRPIFSTFGTSFNDIVSLQHFADGAIFGAQVGFFDRQALDVIQGALDDVAGVDAERFLL